MKIEVCGVCGGVGGRVGSDASKGVLRGRGVRGVKEGTIRGV